MAVDFSGVLGRIRSVNAQVVELYALKSSLQAFRSSLDASWRGSEVIAYDAAIDKLCARIDRAVQSCSDAALLCERRGPVRQRGPGDRACEQGPRTDLVRRARTCATGGGYAGAMKVKRPKMKDGRTVVRYVLSGKDGYDSYQAAPVHRDAG